MLSVFSSIEPRLDGEEYYEFVDEFMAAVKLRWPRALSKLISRKKKSVVISEYKEFSREYACACIPQNIKKDSLNYRRIS